MFFIQMVGLCVLAFLAGAALTWLRLRASIRDLRAEVAKARQASPVAATPVVIPAHEATPEAEEAEVEVKAEAEIAAEAEAVVEAEATPEVEVEAGATPEVEAEIEATREVEAEAPVAVELADVVEGEVEPEEAEVEVKGNSKSLIFHTPDSPYYARMKGDVTFRSVAEAERAGYTQWRPKVKASTNG